MTAQTGHPAGQKVRVYELSKLLGLSNKELMAILEEDFGLQIKSHSSTIEHDVAAKITAKVKGGKTTPEAHKSEAQKKAPEEKSPPESKSPETKAPEAKAQEMKPVASDSGPKPQAPKPAGQGSEQSKLKPAAAPPPQPQTHGGGGRGPSGSSSMGGAPTAPSHPQPGSRAATVAPPPPAPPAKPQSNPQNVGSAPGATHTQGRPRPGHPGGGQSQQRPGQHHGQHHGSQSPHSGPGGHSGGRPGQGPGAGGQHRPGHGSQQRPGNAPPSPPPPPPPPVVEEPIGPVLITRQTTVKDLSELLRLKETEIIKQLFMKGIMVTVNQTLDVEYAKSLVEKLGFEIEKEDTSKKDLEQYSSTTIIEGKEKLDNKKYKNLGHRAPVVSIMGHVDHGKTSLLDAIRETRHKIVDTEAGGITQSIGAYTVEKDDQKIVFLDTPGHEAFTAMRMRGARSTDIAILVVAADDGVMPQTVEAVNHAKAAEIPIIVAVNKIDKEGADPDRVLVQLSEVGLTAEKWGGDVLTVEVSALQRYGLDDLLENILLVAELLDLKADATVPAEGVIIEAQLDKRKGPVASALVQNGTLRIGDNLVMGSVGGRVRALINDMGERITEAGPATPVEILGLDSVPNAGDSFRVVNDEKEYKSLLNTERVKERDDRLSSRRIPTGMGGMKNGQQEEAAQQEFNFIIKADTQGSAEAVNTALIRMGTDEVRINILHSGTGEISEADVMLASASNAIVIGFNVKIDPNAQRVAENLKVVIRHFDVIYHINETIEKLILGQLSPDIKEVECGTSEIRQVFSVGKSKVIAGCMITSGKAVRNAKVRVFRNNQEIYYGSLESLKRFKDDAKEVTQGYECGMSFYKFNDIQAGDRVVIYDTEETFRTSL